QLLDRDPAIAGRANSLAFRLKLLLAAGFAPQLAGCASCGEREHLVGFSGAAGGVVCAACEASAFPLDEEAHAFIVAANRPPPARARCPRPSARFSKRWSTTRTCGCAPSARDRFPAMAGEQWVYDFSKGSKDMRDLLGGKGANVAEMTRVLGPDRVPAGF